MENRIIIFSYYSISKHFPSDCFLDLSPNIVYRNMFLETCSENKIHFEFPMFEDHTYNSICNGKELISLIREPSEYDKYIIFRSKNRIVGYYRVGTAYFQETNFFNRNGFVWGFKADEVHLVKKGSLTYNGPPLGRSKPRSWSNDPKWKKVLNKYLFKIKQQQNIAEEYQSETNRLINIFQDKDKVQKWKDYCSSCSSSNKCTFYNRNRRYKPDNPDHDLFYVINMYYSGDFYSRNILESIPKIPIRK